MRSIGSVSVFVRVSGVALICRGEPSALGTRFTPNPRDRTRHSKETPQVAFSIKRSDPSLRSAVQRIAADQLQGALEALDDPDTATLDTRIHDARKRCKKLRGLIRLVRPGFDGYATVNASLRDAARSLSYLRDSAVFLETYDILAAGARDRDTDRRALAPLRGALSRARPDRSRVAEQVAEFRETLSEILKDVPGWTVEGDEAEVLAGGLARSFGRGRTALARALVAPDGETMHEWRKRAKYHWYHARLLRRAFPEMLVPHRDTADQLADTLGDHHDLAEFARRIRADDMPPEAAAAIEPLLLDRMRLLEADAFRLGRPLFAEDEAALASRWTAWWSLWRDGATG
jgi:CHAD domain-containing protein